MNIQPPNGTEIAAVVEQRLTSRERGTEESTAIAWREDRLTIPVISIPISLTYYNPNTRRIQAQRGVDRERERELLTDPFSEVSQAYLEELLQWDPAKPGTVDPSFEKLRADLKDHGQDEPGLMTRGGLLINGNTRRAALKSLGRQNIRVGILPVDTSRADLDTLELSLQLRKSLKREYSFVNELLAIRAELDKGIPPSQVLRAFRMKQERFDRSIWLLDFINEAIDRSAITRSDGSSIQIRQFDFERDQGQLEELYRAWKNLQRTDPEKADILRETRLIGVTLDFAKTDLRVMDGEFFTTYIEGKLPEGMTVQVDEATPRSIPGLPDVPLPQESLTLRRLREFTNRVLKARAETIASSLDDPASETATTFLKQVRLLYEQGRTSAGANAELRRRSMSPAEKILEAGDDLDAATEALSRAQASNSLDVSALDDALESLRQALTRLTQLFGRVSEDEKDAGFAWAEAAVNALVHEDSQNRK